MSLGTPSTGTGSNWYSQYENDFGVLLQRLQDNTGNQIDAKDVRDMAWTLHNRVLQTASQSATVSAGITFSSTRQTTFQVGGILRGTTLLNQSPLNMFRQMLESYAPPTINSFDSTVDTYQFGQTAPVLSLTYDISPKYSPIFSISFDGPGGSLGSNIPTGNDPEVGTFSGVAPTFSTTPAITETNTFTMSVVTQDGLTFSSDTSITYKHKIYYGPIDLTTIGGFTPSLPSSVVSTRAYLTDTRIKGLTVSSLQTGFAFKDELQFGTGSYFVYAHPTVYGKLPGSGFYTTNMFSTDFTKIRSGSTFSNDYSYQIPYDVWISNNSYDSVEIIVANEG
jgi:hypothetical protein